MPVNPNFTNANATTPYASGGGGNTSNFYELSFDAANNSGAIWPSLVSPSDYTLLTYADWSSGANQFAVSFAGPTLPQPIGASSVWVGAYGGAPYGVIKGVGDGVQISGQDGAANETAVWIEAHNGASQLNYVSTMTDSQKTYTLDFPAFLSTMASVYPEIVKPYK